MFRLGLVLPFLATNGNGVPEWVYTALAIALPIILFLGLLGLSGLFQSREDIEGKPKKPSRVTKKAKSVMDLFRGRTR